MLSRGKPRLSLWQLFLNRIYLYDDKLVITFNYKDGSETISLNETGTALKGENGSDLDSSAVPKCGNAQWVFPHYWEIDRLKSSQVLRK